MHTFKGLAISGKDTTIHPAVCTASRFSRVRLFVTPWTVAHQAPLSRECPGKHTGVGCQALPQGSLPTQGWSPGLRW